MFILPYADILAWCLMPNHFHLMVLVNHENISLKLSYTETGEIKKFRSFNDSIGIMLRSYTRAINKETKRSGKLFREATKAECITCIGGITPSFYTVDGITQINILNPARQYPEICFHYIHQNPVSAGFVKNITDWEFSSARDYAGLRRGQLVNRVAAEELSLGVTRSHAETAPDDG